VQQRELTDVDVRIVLNVQPDVVQERGQRFDALRGERQYEGGRTADGPSRASDPANTTRFS